MVFKRFTRECRVCVEAAVEEARTLGHDSVDDEDLLLGILCAGKGTGAEVLFASGATLHAARKESEAMLSEALSSVGISLEGVRQEAGDAFDMRVPRGRRVPFSPLAKKVLEQALKEAVRLRDGYIGDEHVLLGILGNEDGRAIRILARMGVSPEALRERLFELRGRTAG